MPFAFDAALKAQVSAHVSEAAEHLSDRFYAVMLDDAQARSFLDHAVVNQRLRAAMVRWLRDLFDPTVSRERAAEMHKRTGEVHARIGVPMALVSAGARLLKWDIVAQLARREHADRDLAVMVQFVYETMGSAIDAMNSAWAANVSRLDRSEEAFRLYFLQQNIKAERERQKAQLLEWAHQLLYRGYWGEGEASEPGRASSAPFALWVQHKASILFPDAPELDRIRALMQEIEQGMLPELARLRDKPEAARPLAARMHQRFEDIKTLLSEMFDRHIGAEDALDGTTRLLSRRYFPALVKREIALAQSGAGEFAVLLMEIDRMDALREVQGVESTDALLGSVAEAVLDSVRAGDFAFRIGDAQILVLMAETGPSALAAIAEGMRRRVEGLRVRVSEATLLAPTVTIGAVAFDGHPDYQRLLDRADAALRTARAGGTNRCCVGD
jgi:diguanylate cyclase